MPVPLPHGARQIGLGLLLALLLVMQGTTPSPAQDRQLRWAAAGPQPSSAVPAACRDLLFLGARGSGEAPPYGRTVATVRQELARAGSGPGVGVDVREVWLDFPAEDPHTLADDGLDRLLLSDPPPPTAYADSVQAGVGQVEAVLTDSRARCPDERWVLAGFSQGAEVLTRSLAERDDLDRLAGAVLVGDPTHHLDQGPIAVGSAEPAAHGLIATLTYVRGEVAAARRQGSPEAELAPLAVRSLLQLALGQAAPDRLADAARQAGLQLNPVPRLYSVCDAGDLVCDAGPALIRVATGQSELEAEFERTRAIHGGYDTEGLSEPAQGVVAGLDEVLPAPSPAPTVPRLPVEEARPLTLLATAPLLAALALGLLWWRRRRRPVGRADPSG